MNTKPLPALTAAEATRFWAKVKKAGKDECWLWAGATRWSGYGTFWIGAQKRTVTAHRVAHALTKGDPGTGDICHTCDIRLCCNPKHLFAGSRADNLKDCKRKNRHSRGEIHGMSKLSETDIATIRRLRALSVDERPSQQTLADRYKVHQSTISVICTRTRWAHVA